MSDQFDAFTIVFIAVNLILLIALGVKAVIGLRHVIKHKKLGKLK